MSALVIALVAGMAVGDGPERVSTETEQGLCLDGWWKGTWQQLSDSGEIVISEVTFKNGFSIGPDGEVDTYWVWKDQGNGRCTLSCGGSKYSSFHLGIYKQEPDRLTVCLNRERNYRPTTFRVEDGCILLVLHRVKPPK
jgi:hypothetical protein